MQKEELIKFYQVYKIYIFPFVIILCCLFLIIFAIIPQTTKLLDNQKIEKELAGKAFILDTKVQALEGYNETDLNSKVEVAVNALPQDKDYGQIIGLLQTLTSMSGFNIESINFLGASKYEKSNGYSVKLEISGAQSLFQTLIDNLENSPRLLSISSIDVSSNEQSGSIKASLTLQVMYSPLPQNYGTEESPVAAISDKREKLLSDLKNVMDSVPVVGVSGKVASPVLGKANPFQ